MAGVPHAHRGDDPRIGTQHESAVPEIKQIFEDIHKQIQFDSDIPFVSIMFARMGKIEQRQGAFVGKQEEHRFADDGGDEDMDGLRKSGPERKSHDLQQVALLT